MLETLDLMDSASILNYHHLLELETLLRRGSLTNGSKPTLKT